MRIGTGSGRGAGGINRGLGHVESLGFAIVLFFTGGNNFLTTIIFNFRKWQGGGREGIRDGGINRDFDDDLITSKANEIVLGVEVSQFIHKAVGIGGPNYKAYEGTGITKNSILNFNWKLGGVLIGKN